MPGPIRNGPDPGLFSPALATLAATWRAWLPQFLLISAVTFWIYGPALRGGFLWDDGWYITTNPLLRDMAGLWKFWFQPGSWIEYYPVEETVLWLQWQLGHADTLGYHLTNVILHVVNALLVWHLLGKFGIRLAWLGGLIFAVHPVQVESVAWITELKNTLSLPFFLLAICFWIDYDERKRRQDYEWALLLFLIAMLTKITMAPFPVIILLYTWWKRGRIDGNDLRVSAPFFIISFVLGAVAFWVGNIYDQKYHAQILEIPLGGFLTCFVRAGTILAWYFANSFWPVDLTPLYPKWATNPDSAVAYFPWLGVVGILFWSWTKRRGWGRHVLLGLGFFAINLAPFLGFHAISYMHDTWVELHLLYFPLIGLIGLFVAGLGDLREKLPAAARPAIPSVVAVAIFSLAVSAHAYAGWFRNEETFWTRTLQQNPQAWLAHHDLGCDLLDQGRNQEAAVQLQQAVALLPDYGDGHYNLGLALEKLGQSGAAQEQFLQAIKLNPDNLRVYLNLGEIMRRQGNLAAAEAYFRQGWIKAPYDVALCTNLGGLLLQTGRVSEGISLYKRALEFDPDLTQLQYDLGVALLQTGNVPQAADHLEKAVTLDPKIAAAHENLGVALAQLGHLPEAIGQFQAALQIDPGLVEAHDNLALAFAQTGRLAESADQFRQSLQIDPHDVKARQSLARLQQFEKQKAAPGRN